MKKSTDTKSAANQKTFQMSGQKLKFKLHGKVWQAQSFKIIFLTLKWRSSTIHAYYISRFQIPYL